MSAFNYGYGPVQDVSSSLPFLLLVFMLVFTLLLSNTHYWMSVCHFFTHSRSEVTHTYTCCHGTLTPDISSNDFIARPIMSKGLCGNGSLTPGSAKVCRATTKKKFNMASSPLSGVCCLHVICHWVVFVVIFWTSCSLRYCDNLEISTVPSLCLGLGDLQDLLRSHSWALTSNHLHIPFSWLSWIPWPMAIHEWNCYTTFTLPLSKYLLKMKLFRFLQFSRRQWWSDLVCPQWHWNWIGCKTYILIS